MIVTAGSVNVSCYVYIVDDVGGTNPGEPATGLTHTDLTSGSYLRQGGTRASIGTLSTLAAADSAHSDGGFKEVDATNMPGVYRVDVADAAFATGVDLVVVQLKMAAAHVCAPKEIDIIDVDLRDSVRGGMTALPNAAAEAAGGLATSAGGATGIDDLALASVVGALNDTAAAGDVTSADTVMQYVKQLINILIGGPGIATFPAEAAPANAVSLAEVIRAIHADVTGLNGAAMRGTDSAALATALATAQADLDTITGADGALIATDGLDAAALASDAVTELRSLVSGTADSGTTTTLVDAARTEADDDYWVGCNLLITSGTAANQIRKIVGFTAASDTITVEPAFTQAIGTNTYEILSGESRSELRTASQTSLDNIETDTGTTLQAELDGIQADTEDIQSRLPAALTGGGKMDSDMQAAGTGVITSTVMATDSIDAEALSADAGTEIAAAVRAAIVDRIQFNTAFSNFMFKMVDATDLKTAETGLTPTCTRSIDGAAFAPCANAAVEVSNGWYKIDLDASDLNGTVVVLRFTDALAADREFLIVTNPVS